MVSGAGTSTPTVRSYRPEDMESVVSVLNTSLSWPAADDGLALFEWKHLRSPAGPSMILVAEDAGAIVSVRAFMPRTLVCRSGTALRIAHAVDTVTTQAHRRRGLYTMLTAAALDELATQRVAFIFGVPNGRSHAAARSRGAWELGAVPMRLRPSLRGVLGIPSRHAAGRVMPAQAALADLGALKGLMRAVQRPALPTLGRSAEWLRWRYTPPDGRYRAILAGDSPRDGLLLFRIARRGRRRRAIVCEALAPDGDQEALRRMERLLAASGLADEIAIAVPARVSTRRAIRVRGASVVAQPAASRTRPSPIRDWGLTLGDLDGL